MIPIVINCLMPTAVIISAAGLTWLAPDNLLSNSILGLPSLIIWLSFLCMALFSIFRSHFNASVPDTLVWIAIALSGLALIAFFAGLYRSEGLLCTAPVCPNSLNVAADAKRLFSALGADLLTPDWTLAAGNAPAVKIDHSHSSAFYFSTVTFTTLGYGDFQPVPRLRLIASFQAVMGYAYLGLCVGLLIDFANRK